MDTLALDRAHLNKLDAFYYKVVRQCLNMKSTFYQKVIADTGQQCSNAFLQTTLQSRGFKSPTPSQTIQNRSLKYFGRLLRHPEELTSQVVFTPMGAIRQLTTTNRKGAPRLHWPEIVSTTAINRLDHYQLHKQSPGLGQTLHKWHQPITKAEVSATLGHILGDRLDMTTATRRLKSNSQIRTWQSIC